MYDLVHPYLTPRSPRGGSRTMLNLLLLAHLLLAVSSCLASPYRPLAAINRLKERVPHPRGWLKGERAPSDHTLELKVALPQPSFHILEQHLYEVSDPGHVRYGQHLSKEEVEELVAPHAESVSLVDKWLRSCGVDVEGLTHSPAKDWVTVRIPVSLAESMLDTVRSFHPLTHAMASN